MSNWTLRICTEDRIFYELKSDTFDEAFRALKRACVPFKIVPIAETSNVHSYRIERLPNSQEIAVISRNK